MNQSEKPEFARLLTDVMAYFRQDTSKFMLDLWWGACQNFSLEQVQKSLNAHAMDPERGVFAPKVADVVRALQGTATDRAALAWGKVLGAMSSVGAYQDVVFDDAAIHAAVADCGGWIKVCRGELAELGYLQHRFSQSHRAYTERGTFDYPRMLNGDRSPDAEYLKYGRALPKPAIVGDPEKAAKVMEAGGSGGPRISFQGFEHALAGTKLIGVTA